MAKKKQKFSYKFIRKNNKKLFYVSIIVLLLICILGIYYYASTLNSNPSEVKTKPVNKLIKSQSDLVQNQYKFMVIVASDNKGPNIDSRGYPVIHPDQQSTIVGNYSIAYFTNASDGATAVVPVGAYVNILISPLYYDSSVLPKEGALVSRIGLGSHPTPNGHAGIWYFAKKQGKAVITLTHKGPIQTDITGKFTIHVTQNKLPNEPAGIILSGADNGKIFDISIGSYIETQCLGNKTIIVPSHGIIEYPGGTYNMPNNVCGIWKAVGAGTVIITTENVH